MESLLSGSGVRLERIISAGHATPADSWYDQDDDEWVALLRGEATILFANNDHVQLRAGDTLFIPAHVRHQVEYTSSNPPCVWLALHGRLKLEKLVSR